MPQTKSALKIIHLNMAYGQNFRGNFFDIFRVYRYFLSNKKIKNKFNKNFLKLIYQENPDIIFLTEIKKNDFCLIEALKKNYKYFEIQSKYKPDLREAKMKLSKNNGNGFFSKIKPEKINFRHLNHGRKSLILEVEVKSPQPLLTRGSKNNLNFILGHFSLSRKVRQQQFLEIKNNLDSAKNNIICGDFNNYFGLKEFNIFKDFSPVITKKTFPASYPIFCLDNFLMPENLKNNFKSKVCKNIISDHKAVVLEILN